MPEDLPTHDDIKKLEKKQKINKIIYFYILTTDKTKLTVISVFYICIY